MNSWFRSWHGAPTDPKWLAIAQRTQTNAGTVSAVFWALMDHASQSADRGDVSGFDIEAYAAFSGFDADKIELIIKALESKKLIQDNKLTAWEKRQPIREDGSAERAKEWRERKRTQANAKEHRLDTDKDTERKKVSSAVANATRTEKPNLEFEDFWKEYPKRQGSNPKALARKSFEKLTTKGTPPADLIAASRNFASEVRTLGKENTEFVAMASTWLNQSRHHDYVAGPPQPGVMDEAEKERLWAILRAPLNERSN